MSSAGGLRLLTVFAAILLAGCITTRSGAMVACDSTSRSRIRSGTGPAPNAGRKPRVNLYAVINRPLETYPLCVTDHVLYIAVRISDVWTGERAADSVALTVLEAQRRGLAMARDD